MPKFNPQGRVAVKEATGNEQFFTTQPGDYLATVVQIVDKDPFMSSIPGFENPGTPDGKWPMFKITPTVQLHNERETLIERQDLTIGIMVDGVPFSPNPKNSAVYGGWYNNGKSQRGGSLGAAGLLKAVGVMKVVDGEATFTGDTNEVKGAVVWVHTGVGAYSKSGNNFGPDEFITFLTEQNEGKLPPFTEYHIILNKYNEAQGFKGTDKEIKMKNFIMDVWALTDAEVESKGFFRDATGAVYVTKPAGAKAAPKSAKAAGASAKTTW